MHRAQVRLGRRRFLAMAVGLLPVSLSYRATLAEAEAPIIARAEAVVRDLAERAWDLLHRRDLDQRQRLDELTELLNSETDVAALSRLVLGRHWQRLSEAQRGGYEELFATVVMRSLAARLDQYTNSVQGPLDQSFRIIAGQPVGKGDVLVRTQVVTPGGEPVAVDWRLRARADRPVIIDLVIAGVSLLVAHRSEFAAVIERSDMDGLLAELRARAQATRS